VREKARRSGILPDDRVRLLSLRFTLQLRRPASLARIAVFSVGRKTSAAGDDLARLLLSRMKASFSRTFSRRFCHP
jgi:hypothetical protein